MQKRGVTPVIATVLLISIVIVLAGIVFNFFDDFRHGRLVIILHLWIPRELAVAPGAAQVAGAQPQKNGGLAGAGAFPLNGIKNFV